MFLGCVSAKGRRFVALAGIAGVAASVLVAASSPAEAARRKHRGGGGGYNPPYADMVVDVKTGRVLHAVNEDALRHPASVTKVMTLYLLFEQLERGKLSLDTELQVSAHAASQAPSKLGLRPGSTIAVEDAIKALVTKSANDVAVVIAENLGGSEDEFAEMMTRKAGALGMSRTVYRNASGLPDPEQVTTARDLTVLARAIQDRFPRYYRYFQTRVFEYAGAAHRNHNKLLGRVEGVDGIKTGYTRASGFNLMTNAKTDTQHIVAVVLGGRSGPSRDQIMANLVRSNLPRAYAGARTAPVVAEGSAPAAPAVVRPTQVADATPGEPLPLQRQALPSVETTAATVPVKKPLDLAALRPVVASAAGAGTATPSQPLRLQPNGLAALPTAAQAYAPSAAPAPAPMPVPAPRAEDRAPAPVQVAKAVATEPKKEARPAVTPWVIQLGAMDDEDKAKEMLSEAKSKSGRTLARASAFTEKVTKGSATLYRARFSGFQESDEAEAACKSLKRAGYSCFATRS